jgi:hypothetical protein
MVRNSRNNLYLCTNVVGDHGLDYVIATIIDGFPLSFSESILDYGGLNHEIILIMVLVVFIMHYPILLVVFLWIIMKQLFNLEIQMVIMVLMILLHISYYCGDLIGSNEIVLI